jgi:hypothetical protein
MQQQRNERCRGNGSSRPRFAAGTQPARQAAQRRARRGAALRLRSHSLGDALVGLAPLFLVLLAVLLPLQQKGKKAGS